MKVVLFGDSHCRMFFGSEKNIIYNSIEFINNYQSKVSLKGLENEHSKSNMRGIIFESIKTITDSDIVCLKFGQVDLEYVFYYKKYVKNETITIETFIHSLIDIYIHFIKELSSYCKNIVVISTNLPNKHFFLEAIQGSINKKIDVDYNDLCRHFNLFNEQLNCTLEKYKIPFLNLFPFIGKKVDSFYILKEIFYGKDNHVRGSEYITCINSERKTNPSYGKYENNLFLQEFYNFIKSL
jgi:hypothetical protein